MPRTADTSNETLESNQSNISNILIDSETSHTEEEVQNSTQNSSRNGQNTTIKILSNDHVRSILIEIEYTQDDITDVDQLECETIKRVQQLLVNLKNQGMIKGVYAKDHNYLVDDLDDINEWLHDPRIT